jgi:hypothetical protein
MERVSAALTRQPEHPGTKAINAGVWGRAPGIQGCAVFGDTSWSQNFVRWRSSATSSPFSHLFALEGCMSIFVPGFAITSTAYKARLITALTRSRTKTSVPAPALDNFVSS